jgi:flagellar biosynthesis protein FlhF
MKIKSYFARTVEDAVAQAREELGPDAMLVNSRRAEEEAREMGEYEVVFAADSGSATPVSSSSNAAQPFPDRLSTEVADLKRELEGMRRTLTRSAFAPSQWLPSSPEASEAYAELISNEVAPDLAREIVQSAAGGARGSSFAQALAGELESRIAVEPALGRGDARPRVVALVGPPGCGKTTTLVKLAVNYGLATRRPALLLSMDTYRIAAAEQLRSYAAIIGIGFSVLETVAALAQAIEENRGKDLIFIDTPGFGFGDMDQAAQLAGFLARRSDIDTHLVLACSMKSADLTRVTDAYEPFHPQRLLFTKLDETGSFGCILNETLRTGRPLSFFSNGQRIPEDLEAASPDRVLKLVYAGSPARARSAA